MQQNPETKSYVPELQISSADNTFLFAGCNQKHQLIRHEDGLSSFNADSIKKYISALTSDSFCGRKQFTSGETKTINYLQQ